MHGGARKGAGRPKGAPNNPFRQALIKWMDKPEIRKKYFAALEFHIDQKDKYILTWLGDQRAGKAVQAVEMDMDIEQTIYDAGVLNEQQIRRALERRRNRGGDSQKHDGGGDDARAQPA